MGCVVFIWKATVFGALVNRSTGLLIQVYRFISKGLNGEKEKTLIIQHLQ